MNEWTALWLIAAVVLGVVEASTTNLITIWFAVSALVTAVFAAMGAETGVQVTVFIVLSVILVAATRPLAKRFITKKAVATNADRIISAQGIVIHRIDPVENLGQVKVMGQVWSAKSQNGETIEEGTSVVVQALEGVKVVVSAKI